MDRQCLFCGKQCKNGSGLGRHLSKCRKRNAREPGRYDRSGFPIAARTVICRQVVGVKPGGVFGLDNLEGQPPRQPTTAGLRGQEDTRPTNNNAANTFDSDVHRHTLDAGMDLEDTAKLTTALGTDRVENLSDCRRSIDSDVPVDALSSAISTILSQKTRTSSSLTATSVEEYPQARGAGRPIEMRADGIAVSSPEDPDEAWRPFDSEADYALANWMHESKLSSGAIDKFFKDMRLRPFHGTASFNSAATLKEKMHMIEKTTPTGQWERFEIELPSFGKGLPATKHNILYRNVMDLIGLMIGHPPFASNMAYSPIRQRNADGGLIFSEMHTANWWWETQDQLPPNATIIPIIMATDKTHLSQTHGDQQAWPVYITIGNLDRKTRRASRRPGLVLLGLIPIVHKRARAEVYHYAMGRMLRPLEEHSKAGINLTCADGAVRRCHPILAVMTGDYEEQVLITSVKSNRHCPICEVAPGERENLCVSHAIRTHNSTKLRLSRQRLESHISTEMDTHDISNFGWKHHLFNVHTAQTFDMLHNFFVHGMIEYIMTWFQKAVRVGRTEVEAQNILDDRFRQVPHFTGLRRFPHFSRVSQWTGEEGKAILRQLMPVFAPLLVEDFPDLLQAGRAIVDFMMLARYRSHDEESLRYLSAAEFRINLLKEALRKYRPVNNNTHEGHLNFAKWHAMSHCTTTIRTFGALDGYSTQTSERAHIGALKRVYPLTNRRENFLEQIMNHNVRNVNMIAMADIIQYRESEAAPRSISDMDGKSIFAGHRLNLDDFGWKFSADRGGPSKTWYGCDCKEWREAKAIADRLQLSGFLEALASFIRADRMKDAGHDKLQSNINIDRREFDCTWVYNYPVSILRSITCWKVTGDDSSDLDRLEKDLIKCAPSSNSIDETWRRDCVWVQEFETGPAAASTFQSGKLVGQVQIIIEVLDMDNRDFKGRPQRIQGALIDVFEYRHGGQIQECHGMIEVERARQSNAANPRTIGSRRFYGLPCIERSAHLIPATIKGRDIFYINNYIDWGQYNSIYDPDFLATDIRAAERVYRRLRGHKGQSHRIT